MTEKVSLVYKLMREFCESVEVSKATIPTIHRLVKPDGSLR